METDLTYTFPSEDGREEPSKRDTSTYLVIRGTHRSTKSPVDYVEHIVYGAPRIEAVLVGSHFVALVEFPEGQETWANGTFNRMGSFPHGVTLCRDKAIALREFGSWVYHYAPGTIVQ